jgi:RimJ/RimL family protein N-acetyltransferase
MVTLRDLTNMDLETVVRWRNDPEVNRYLADRIKTREETQVWFRRIKDDPRNMLKAILYDECMVGYVIVENVGEQNRKCEVGIIIGETSFWGRGIGRIAIKRVLSYCFRDLRLHRVLAVIASGNERSELLFKRLDFKHEGTLREATKVAGQFTDLLCYSILENEYEG